MQAPAARTIVLTALAHGEWTKATRSSGSGCCVELHFQPAFVLIRDSKYRRSGAGSFDDEPVIVVTRSTWAQFLTSLQLAPGSWRNDSLAVTYDRSGVVLSSLTDGVHLRYTHPEWDAFLDGVANQEFASR